VFEVGAAPADPAGAGSPLAGAEVAVDPPHAAAMTATVANRPRRRFC